MNKHGKDQDLIFDPGVVLGSCSIRTQEKLGRALKEYRRKYGMTQRQIAEQTNLRVATVSALEIGELGCRLDTLIKVMTVLELELALRPRSSHWSGAASKIGNEFFPGPGSISDG